MTDAQPVLGPNAQFDWRKPMASLPYIVGRIVRRTNPLKIILFGSHARGDAKVGSDLDLLVIVDQADDLRAARVELQNSLGRMTVPVDIIVATPELLTKYASLSLYVFRSALEEGVTVYERG